MIVHCPRCHSEQPTPAAGDDPRHHAMARCAHCGTRWLPRPYEGLLPLSAGRAEVSDAVVVEERARLARPRSPPPPVTGLPPRWRRAPVDRRLKWLGVGLGVLAAFFVLRAPIVSALPELKRLPVDAGKFEFRKVRSETVSMRGVSTLFIEGEIVNRATGHSALPAVRITLKAADGAPVASWLVDLAVDSLAAGRSIGFRSALVSPPPDAAQVTLNLAERQEPADLR